MCIGYQQTFVPSEMHNTVEVTRAQLLHKIGPFGITPVKLQLINDLLEGLMIYAILKWCGIEEMREQASGKSGIIRRHLTERSVP